MGLGTQALWSLCKSVVREQGQVTQGFSVQVGVPLQHPAEAGEARAGSGTPELTGWSAVEPGGSVTPSVTGRGALPNYCWWLPSRVSQSWGEG